MGSSVRLDSIRPLVRYVDEDQAVIDAHFTASCPLMTDEIPAGREVEVLLRIEGDDGFYDEGQTHVILDAKGSGGARFEIIKPCRWWPAGMGMQPMYELTLGLASDGELMDHDSVSFGLTSIRRDVGDDTPLLVNGQVCDIESVVMVDRVSEDRLLPVTGASLMFVRDHYAPEILYRAADRAGILMVQSVPIDPCATPESIIDQQVARLSSHPSLAGWFVGHLGKIADTVARRIGELDPTHAVFRRYPLNPAA